MATAPQIKLEPINSSRIAAVGFDADSFTLAVKFPPTKAAPMGKVYHYSGIDEMMFEDLKNAESIGRFFGETIVANPQRFPFVCVDPGTVVDPMEAPATPEVPAAESGTVLVTEGTVSVVPDDAEAIKAFALEARAEATAISIETADECEAASREVLKIREQRKIAVAKVNAIKEPATQAWKAACALFNEVDGRFAEAEKYLDDGILAYRERERRRIAAETAAHEAAQRAQREAAEREQREEFARRQAQAKAEADQRAKVLAEQDAAAAEQAGAPDEIVQQIRENPLPVTIEPVAPPPLAFFPSSMSIPKANIPKVDGLSFMTAWEYEIVDESLIPLSHDYFTLDSKKIAAKVDALKQHANIPGVRVFSKEVPRKRTAGRK